MFPIFRDRGAAKGGEGGGGHVPPSNNCKLRIRVRIRIRV